MKQELPISLLKRKEYVVRVLKDKVLPTDRNFLPFTYDMKESFSGSIVGGNPMFVYMPIDTSHMSVISILEEEEKIIKAGEKESLKVVTEAERDEMTAVTIALNPLVCGLETDKEKVEYLLEEYPELQSWL